jgi:hypothetical protein
MVVRLLIRCKRYDTGESAIFRSYMGLDDVCELAILPGLEHRQQTSVARQAFPVQTSVHIFPPDR